MIPEKKMTHGILFFAFPLAGLFPQTAFACAVCSSGREESMGVYYLSATVLTILPLAMIGGIAAWIYYQYKKSALQESEDRG